MGLTKDLGALPRAITVSSANNVGIGASGPNTLLQIGTGGGAVATNSIVYLGGYSSGVSQLRYIMNHNGAANAGIGTPSAGGILFGYGLVDGTVSGEWMRINTSGNVGIGTQSPLSGGGSAKWLTVDGTTYGGGFISSVNGVSKGTLYYDNASLTFSMYAPTGVGATIHTNGSERMRITSNGNTLIGTQTETGQKLQVAGLANIYSGNSSFQQSTNTAASGSSVTFNMGTNYGQGTNGDNIAGLVIIAVNEASTNIAQGNAIYIGSIINPRGTGATLTQISKVQGAGVTSLSITTTPGNNIITVNATLSSGATYRANLTFIGGGGTS